MTRPGCADGTSATLRRLGARAGGVSQPEAGQATGKPPHLVCVALAQLVQRGSLHAAGPRGKRRYFTCPAAAAAYEAGFGAAATLRGPARPQRAGLKRANDLAFAPPRLARSPQLDPAVPVVVPEHVKVTMCPGVRPDPRYTFEPPPGWTGQITRDWRERRLAQLPAEPPASTPSGDAP